MLIIPESVTVLVLKKTITYCLEQIKLEQNRATLEK